MFLLQKIKMSGSKEFGRPTFVSMQKSRKDDDDDNDDDDDDDDGDANNLFKRVKFSLEQKQKARPTRKDEHCADDADEDQKDEFNRSVNRRPVATISAVKRMFDADPKKSIKDNVPVHTSNEDLDNYRQEISKIAHNKEQQNKVADALWDNEDYSFIKMVQGMTRDTTLMNREVSVPSNTNGSALVQNGPFSEKFYAAPVGFNVATEREISAFMQQTESKAYKPANIDAYSSEFIERQDKMRVLENIDRVTDLPQVSGVVQMSSAMYAALLAALSSLASMNKKKFGYKERYHFFKDGHVKTMFAKLVAAFIAESKVINPNQYYLDRSEGRRDAKIEFALKNLDNNTVWQASKCAFVFATDEETEEIKMTKRRRLAEAYDMSGLFN